jgi:hypothetical protein
MGSFILFFQIKIPKSSVWWPHVGLGTWNSSTLLPHINIVQIGYIQYKTTNTFSIVLFRFMKENTLDTLDTLLETGTQYFRVF